MVVISANEVRVEPKRANKHELHKLDMLREEYMIPWVSLNKLAREVLQTDAKDCRDLTVSENRSLQLYMKNNAWALMTRYRREVFGG